MKNMCELRKVFGIFLMLGLNKLSLGLNKHWLPNQEWNSEDNWIEGRVPDLDSHIIFPLEMRHVAGLPFEDDLRFSEIDLPANGALVLAKNGALQIVHKPKKEAKIGRWSREGQLFWADPQNWNYTSEAVPHVERLPCQMDFAILPDKVHVFNMRLPVKEVQVKSIWLNNEKTEIGFSEWYQRVRGREFASSRPSVSYSQLQGCERCMCQEGKQSEYLEEVCDIQRPRCGYSTCAYPLKVEGHCCDYCGARLLLSKNVYTRSVKRLTNEALNPYDTTISWYVRTTWEGGVEILVAEKGQYSGIRSQEALQLLESYLKEEGIEVLRTEISGGSLQNNRVSAVLSPLFGGLIFALAFLSIIFSYYGYTYTQVLQGTREVWFSIRDDVRNDGSKGPSYGFARFENLPEGGVQLAGSTISEYDDDVNDDDEDEPSSSGGRFENPLYRSKRESKKEMKVEELKIIDFNSHASLVALKNTIQDDDFEEVEMTIEEISETEQ